MTDQKATDIIGVILVNGTTILFDPNETDKQKVLADFAKEAGVDTLPIHAVRFSMLPGERGNVIGSALLLCDGDFTTCIDKVRVKKLTLKAGDGPGFEQLVAYDDPTSKILTEFKVDVNTRYETGEVLVVDNDNIHSVHIDVSFKNMNTRGCL